mmetsp:Transcript_29137/g.56146  ORF Transcript_29137/g.56146 Transcript_29137/m.56146 type:complete len:296 (+) Transcript_29137:2967-3854(+)
MHLRPGRADGVNRSGDPAKFCIRRRVRQVSGGIIGPVGVDQFFRSCPLPPQLFGDEGHDGVQQDQALIEPPGIDRPGFGDFRLCAAFENRLGQLDIPVAKRAPHKGVKRAGGVVEPVIGQCRVNRFAGARDLALDPAVGGECCRRDRVAVGHVKGAVALAKAGRVPEFGAEIPVARDALGVEFQRATKRGHRGGGKAQRVGTVFVDQVERVHDIAGGFRHFLALGVANKAVQVHGIKGLFVHHSQLHHHHAGHPEEQDVLAGDQVGGGEILFQRIRIFGPAEGADGPEAGGEPCV